MFLAIFKDMMIIMETRPYTLGILSGYPKVRKGLLFAQRSPFREKDYPKMRKGLFCHEKKFHLLKVYSPLCIEMLQKDK